VSRIRPRVSYIMEGPGILRLEDIRLGPGWYFGSFFYSSRKNPMPYDLRKDLSPEDFYISRSNSLAFIWRA
jgi:hypothetical protein